MLTITIKYKDSTKENTVITSDVENLTTIYTTPAENMHHYNIERSISDLSDSQLKQVWEQLKVIDTNTISEILISYDIVSYHKEHGINTFDYIIQSRGTKLSEILIFWG